MGSDGNERGAWKSGRVFGASFRDGQNGARPVRAGMERGGDQPLRGTAERPVKRRVRRPLRSRFGLCRENRRSYFDARSGRHRVGALPFVRHPADDGNGRKCGKHPARAVHIRLDRYRKAGPRGGHADEAKGVHPRFQNGGGGRAADFLDAFSAKRRRSDRDKPYLPRAAGDFYGGVFKLSGSGHPRAGGEPWNADRGVQKPDAGVPEPDAVSDGCALYPDFFLKPDRGRAGNEISKTEKRGIAQNGEQDVRIRGGRA